MKTKFSKSWNSSKQPRKQRKYVANAPKHILKKFLRANLAKNLRKKFGVRSLTIRKGDIVRIMIGKFKKKTGKVLKVNYKKLKIEIEGIQIKKMDGSKVNVRITPSNVQIVELNMDDKKRLKENTEVKNKENALK